MAKIYHLQNKILYAQNMTRQENEIGTSIVEIMIFVRAIASRRRRRGPLSLSRARSQLFHGNTPLTKLLVLF